MSNETFEQWAIVEIFGHQRIAGLVTEHAIGGQSFVRVDVPKVGGRDAFTKLYGSGAIYAISFVDRDVALAAAEKLDIAPVTPYSLASVTSDAVQNRLRLASGGYDDDDFPV